MKKRLMVVMGLAVAALGIGATAAVLGTTPAVFTRATGETRSIVLTAADFTAESGNFNRSGIEFHYDNASVGGNTVTLTKGRVYMTTAHYSGDSLSEGGLRGNGFTALTIADLNKTGDGSVVYAKQDVEGPATGFEVASSIDLTKGGTLASAERVRVMVECGQATISFTKMTFTYQCVEATPTVVISGDASVNKDSNITLTAETQDIADTATYNWTSSDTDVATIVGNGKTATVTGVAGGDATITVQAIVGTDVVDSDTFAITVIEEAATYQKIEVLSTTRWEGSGVFYHINPSSVGKTSAQLGALSFSSELINLTANPLSFAMNNGHDYGHAGINQDANTRIYMTATVAPSNSDKYALRLEFKDAVNNVIYYSLARFQGGSLLPDVQITASSSTVDIEKDLALTAVINDEEFNPTSYVWASSDDTVATVVGNNLSATVTGVKAGTATITLTATDASSDVRVGTFALTVEDPAHITYLGWDKTNKNANEGPIYFQGAGVIFAVDLSSIGRTRDSANAVINQVTIETTKNGAKKDVFQKPAFAAAEGLYVTFPDAVFSSMTSVTIRVPNNDPTPTMTVAEMTLSWSGSTYTILTLNGQSFAAYMAAA